MIKKDFITLTQDTFEKLTKEVIKIVNETPIYPNVKVRLLNEVDCNNLKRVDHSVERWINWSYILSEKQEVDGGFDFGITWHTAQNLIGVVISAYKPKEKCLEIYGIERLDDAIKGHIMQFSLYVCYILLGLVEGHSIKVIDVEKGNNALRGFYKSLGFEKINDSDFSLDFKTLENLFTKHRDEGV